MPSWYDDDFDVMSKIIIVWLIIVLAVWIAIAVVVIHFIAKWW